MNHLDPRFFELGDLFFQIAAFLGKTDQLNLVRIAGKSIDSSEKGVETSLGSTFIERFVANDDSYFRQESVPGQKEGMWRQGRHPDRAGFILSKV